MSRELLVKVRYNDNVNVCYYYTNYTFMEYSPSDDTMVCEGTWEFREDGVWYRLANEYQHSAVDEWMKDDYSEPIVNAMLEKELLC